MDKKEIVSYKKGGTEIGKAMAEKSRGLFSADDWQCKSCGNVNWARRTACNMCNAPKYGRIEPRTGYGGGYMERDEVVEYIKRNESDDEYDEFGRKKKKFRKADDEKDKATIPKDTARSVDEDDNKEEEEDDEDEDGAGDVSKYKLDSEEDEEDDDEDGDLSKYKLVDSEEENDKSKSRKSRSRSSSSRSSSRSASSYSSSSGSGSRSRSRSRSYSRSPSSSSSRSSRSSSQRSQSRSISRSRSRSSSVSSATSDQQIASERGQSDEKRKRQSHRRNCSGSRSR
ncbi:finger Ran-binding domain-containing 2 [Octopus vulgaris]|nr:finger Ran-binding domain-containing 2 [Octopus vulgaris]